MARLRQSHAGEGITKGDGGLWKPMTDPRIRAVMPMAPEGAWLFGKRGLAAVDRPVLIIGAGKDEVCPYELEAVPIFQGLTGPDKAMITLVGRAHLSMTGEPDQVVPIHHFAAAFFGYHLQGRSEYKPYFSQEFVARHKDLAWGPVASK